MARKNDLTHLFKVGQKVKIRNDDFDIMQKWNNGIVKEVYSDHIIVTNTDLNYNGWYEENLNIGNIYPDYNFR